MLNVLYEGFPDCVTDHTGKDYKIVTDFRDWIRFIDLVEDSSVPADNKARIILRWYTGDYPQDIKEAFDLLVGFLKMDSVPCIGKASDSAGKSHNKKVYAFPYDADSIIAAFRQCYGLNIMDADTQMHWWEFRMLLNNLPKDTEFKFRVSYRSMDVGSIKSKDERRRVRQIQNSIALPSEVVELDDYEIGNVFM